jgi:hypothetical protein
VQDDVLSFVLDGLEDYLELERELGVRAVEVDRALLATPPSDVVAVAPRVAPVAPMAKRDVSDVRVVRDERPTPPLRGEAVSHRFEKESSILSFAFIHDRPLSPRAVEMMSKIIVALGQTSETAPIAVAPPLPKARFYVFLGNRALQKYLPGTHVEENSWFKTPKGMDALFVRSPEDIVRFPTITPALQKTKADMWRALKTIKQRASVS